MFSSIQIVNSYHLKIIALIIMVLDHFGAMFYPDIDFIRIVGRVAFIIYAFMLVEGFFLTKNINKYIFKIFIWAFISEIPFDLAFHQTPFFFGQQNIFFTLLLGIIGMYCFYKFQNFFISLLIGMIILFGAYFMKVDYSWYGVSVIFVFYFFRKIPLLKFIVIETLSIIAACTISALQIFAFLGFIPLLLYNGNQGKKIGNIYYSFYAIHLLIFSFIKVCFFK